MTHPQDSSGSADEALDNDLAEVYGKVSEEPGDEMPELRSERREFAPWHHPVKQVVRVHQWAELTVRLLKERPTPAAARPLRYFTLPGADLMDVRVLSDACFPHGVKITYFGFNSAAGDGAPASKPIKMATAPWTAAESSLLQSERITQDAVIYGDRLEDIAVPKSQAASQLAGQAPFDVVNIDACDHLAYTPKGRTQNTFDALNALLAHQLHSREPWLLFLTTRATPSLMGDPGLKFQGAVLDNLKAANTNFDSALATCLAADLGKLASELSAAWSQHDERFLRLYALGLGKYLLHYYYTQRNMPANVELASVYAYRVHGNAGDAPDMLAIAFRIIPEGLQVVAPSASNVATYPPLEPVRATRIAERAQRLQDLDSKVSTDSTLLAKAVEGTKHLLKAGNYDIGEWIQWLSKHPQRPLVVS